MLDETRTIESDTELVRTARPAAASRRVTTRAKSGQSKPASVRVEVPPARDIILRLIELIKQV